YCKRIFQIGRRRMQIASVLCSSPTAFASLAPASKDRRYPGRQGMTRSLVLVLLAGLTALGTQNSSPPVTFSKDVLPILQKNCQPCHRSGGVAPMSFQTYGSTRPWAKAIKSAVLNKQMPPWFADPRYGDFRNAPNLTSSDIHTLAVWADGGANEGSPA